MIALCPVSGQIFPSLTFQETFLLSGQSDVGRGLGCKEIALP